MSRVFDENIECTELILRIILDRQDIIVDEVHTQHEIKNLKGHSVTLDILARDTDGKPMNVEVQRADKGAEVKRARYNSSLMDAEALGKGEDYDKLPESYVIFITENDVMKGGRPIYHADRVVTETGQSLGDGSHIIYVNGGYRGESPLGWLMSDFACQSPADMHYRKLAEHVRYYKENEKGVNSMSGVMEELINNEKKDIAKDLLKLGKLTKEDIVESFGLTKEEVDALAEELKLEAV